VIWALLLYFTLLLAVMPVVHWAILRGHNQWVAGVVAGGIAYLVFRWMVGTATTKEFTRLPWALGLLLVVVLAIWIYDYLQSRFRD